MPADTGAIAKPAAAQEIAAPHVFVAVNAVMRELAREGVSKDQRNQQQNYAFRGIDGVMNALSGALAKNHLLIFPRVLSRACDERTTKNGTILYSVTLEVEYDFVSALDGSSKLVGPFPGEAMDSGDKATNKALSAAYKYMATETFCIPTEGDNDADAQTPAETVRAAPRINASEAKKQDVWPRLMKVLTIVESEDDLASFRRANAAKIAAMPDHWQTELEEEIEKHMEALAARQAADREIDREMRAHV